MTASIEPPRLYAAFRYADAAGMIDWLVKAVGFEVHAIHRDGDIIAHAELRFGSAMIMVAQARDDAYGRIVGGPGATGGKAMYVAVDDADAAFARAKAAGARIEEGLVDRDYGSREFICRDPEGNLWCFGTYWPKAGSPSADG